MEEHLQFIEEFAETISRTFQQFAALCRMQLKKPKDHNRVDENATNMALKQKKDREEIQEKLKGRLAGQKSNEGCQSEKKKLIPQNAFTIYVADQRDKIQKEHPGLDFYKITSLAAIRWKKLSAQQQRPYEKKFEEIKRTYQEKQNPSGTVIIQNPQISALSKHELKEEKRIRKQSEQNALNNSQHNAEEGMATQHVDHYENMLATQVVAEETTAENRRQPGEVQRLQDVFSIRNEGAAYQLRIKGDPLVQTVLQTDEHDHEEEKSQENAKLNQEYNQSQARKQFYLQQNIASPSLQIIDHLSISAQKNEQRKAQKNETKPESEVIVIQSTIPSND